jgi:hypothetical protein
MRFSLDIGDTDRHHIEYERNWFTGKERLLADGKLVARRSIRRYHAAFAIFSLIALTLALFTDPMLIQ